MIAHNAEINLYTDIMIIQTLSNNGLSKTAGMGEDLIGSVGTYFGNHLDPKNMGGSLLNFIAPGAIFLTFKALNMTWIGTLFSLAFSVFHIDISSIVTSIYNSIKGIIGSGKKTTSSEVDGIVQSAVKAHVTPAAEEEAKQSFESHSKFLRDARIVKLSMIQFDSLKTIKNAGPKSKSFMDYVSNFGEQKPKVGGALSRVLGLFFKIAIASAGFMVAGDLINKYLLHRPSAIDGPVKPGSSQSAPTATATETHVSTQTKFKVQPTYRETKSTGNWVLSIPNNPDSIGNLLISFAKKVYQGLDGLESDIISAPGFQVVRDRITRYNQSSAGDNMVYIPKYFTSEKMIVDWFIDDVAEKATQ